MAVGELTLETTEAVRQERVSRQPLTRERAPGAPEGTKRREWASTGGDSDGGSAESDEFKVFSRVRVPSTPLKTVEVP